MQKLLIREIGGYKIASPEDVPVDNDVSEKP